MTTLSALAGDALGARRLVLTSEDRRRIAEGHTTLEQRLADGESVYGVTRGFGPLVAYAADHDGAAQGLGLVHHLCTGQGRPLGREATVLAVWLRLQGMRHGWSAVSADHWEAVADLLGRGFVPVVPGEGSLSASGDLVPLAHAALALGGEGEAWLDTGAGPVAAPAAQVIAELGGAPVAWSARSALAFVNGTSVSLAVAVLNQLELVAQARALAALTGHIAGLLGCDPQAYAEPLQRVRPHPGQRRAAEWIRAELPADARRGADRPLQEPYSLRCAPQVIGAVLDQLDAQGAVLATEAAGCTDNPVVVDGQVWHGGNFHALPVGLASDQLTLCAHQLAFLAERQLALLVDPAHNGGLPPMLTPTPGARSGLAGVQIAATSMVAKARQLGLPATLTPLPTNLGNQDHVPMALNGALAGEEVIRLGWLVLGSLAVAITQWERLAGRTPAAGRIWAELRALMPALTEDRPLAGTVAAAGASLRTHFREPGAAYAPQGPVAADGPEAVGGPVAVRAPVTVDGGSGR
ncbi:aromatic amino acid lyase [Streptomyces sp. NPDC101191]|uniref:aromatic amino acid lyase n=1 Tax=Streptomyces sp. NPDC101191 TaxID=3366126 RepID=UPI00382F812A